MLETDGRNGTEDKLIGISLKMCGFCHQFIHHDIDSYQ